jgi:hypothetical protein
MHDTRLIECNYSSSIAEYPAWYKLLVQEGWRRVLEEETVDKAVASAVMHDFAAAFVPDSVSVDAACGRLTKLVDAAHWRQDHSVLKKWLYEVSQDACRELLLCVVPNCDDFSMHLLANVIDAKGLTDDSALQRCLLEEAVRVGRNGAFRARVEAATGHGIGRTSERMLFNTIVASALSVKQQIELIEAFETDLATLVCAELRKDSPRPAQLLRQGDPPPIKCAFGVWFDAFKAHTGLHRWREQNRRSAYTSSVAFICINDRTAKLYDVMGYNIAKLSLMSSDGVELEATFQSDDAWERLSFAPSTDSLTLFYDNETRRTVHRCPADPRRFQWYLQHIGELPPYFAPELDATRVACLLRQGKIDGTISSATL